MAPAMASREASMAVGGVFFVAHHGSECADGEKFAYVWFELCENGYPGEIK